MDPIKLRKAPFPSHLLEIKVHPSWLAVQLEPERHPTRACRCHGYRGCDSAKWQDFLLHLSSAGLWSACRNLLLCQNVLFFTGKYSIPYNLDC